MALSSSSDRLRGIEELAETAYVSESTANGMYVSSLPAGVAARFRLEERAKSRQPKVAELELSEASRAARPAEEPFGRANSQPVARVLMVGEPVAL
jgi:hypothetical protein